MAADAVAMAKQVVADLRQKCETPVSLLHDVASAMAHEMGARLEKEGGSKVKTLLSYVDRLPTGLVLPYFLFLLQFL
jgi:hexokinase